MRLIDADSLLERLHRDPLFDLIEHYGMSGVINAEPIVDAVPVTRCKDCKFSMSGIDKNSERYILCQLHERSYGVTDDGFCKWAERKEE